MISVTEAKSKLFDLVQPLGTEVVDLAAASGRVLAETVTSTRAQPPFASSAMDGYAVAQAEPGQVLKVKGESSAGHRFDGLVKSSQAVRIFTGAVVPEGATRIIIQEDVDVEADQITLHRNLDTKSYIRPAGGDFEPGAKVKAPVVLTPGLISLLASMNVPKLMVYKRPVIAVLSTGDELVMPGEHPSKDQFIASNALGLKALFESKGAEVRVLPIARDTASSLTTAYKLAQGADLLVTIGGASVGDHDLVRSTAQSFGLDQTFYKVAMRPGKPLMAGKMGGMTMVGLPGNPVSSMVCGTVFIFPMIDRMQGLPAHQPYRSANLSHELSANGAREHYVRARLEGGQVTVFDRQDSSLLTVLADANCLAIRPPHAKAAQKGDAIEVLPL